MLFQKDALVKELEAKIKLMEDSVSEVDPRKIMKQFQKQEEDSAQFEAKTEKVESMYRDIFKRFEDSQKILESIKSVENLKNKVNEMEDLVSKSIENKAEVDRLAGKTEKFYTEIEDKIKDFTKMKTDLERIDDLTKEMTKSIDEVNINIVGVSKKEDLDKFKSTIDDVIISNKEKLEERLKEIEDSLNIPTEELSSNVVELQNKREGIVNLMKNIEEQYKKGAIKKETFEEVEEKNEIVLKKLEEDIKSVENQKGVTIKSLPNLMNEIQENLRMLNSKTAQMEQEVEPFKNLESRTYVLENSSEQIKETLKKIEPDKISRITNIVNIQTEIVNDILSKLKEVNRRLMDAKVNLSDYDNRTRFFEILNILVRDRSVDEIYGYLNELERLILKMKLDKLWSKEKQDLTENLLMELSENWHELNRDDVAKLYKDFMERLKASTLNR
jgi:chromosome segregation ATPase